MEKKTGLFLIFSVLFLSINLISAINLDVSANPISNKVIVDLNEPATFDLTIRNLGQTQEFEIYSLIGMDISPNTKITIPTGETNVLRISAMPQQALKSNKGFMTFEYRIKDEENQIQKETLTVNIIGLGSVFSVSPEVINPNTETTIVSIENQANVDFNEVKVNMNSAFFSLEKTLSFKALEKKQIEINMDESINNLVAGNYLLNTEVEIQGKKAKIESIIKYLEQENIDTNELSEGIIIKRQEISKKNLGNVRKEVEITAQKNLISYLFTTFNVAPTSTSFKGFSKQYTWKKELIPNEELKVIIKTNWFFPLIVILLIVALFLLIKKSVETDLILRKKVSFVKTKGGQFALKVSIKVKAKKFIERINVIDKLPHLVKLYERFGAVSPDKIDLQNRRLEWNIEALNQGEERIFTYIIYSKIGIVGRFELPSTKAVYEKEGKVKKSESNRSFYINEPKNN